MIDKTDIDGVDIEYFDIIGKKEFGIVLRSRNTGHYWHLLEQVYNDCRTFQISHKHHTTDAFHLQKNRPTIEACCDYIKSHDAYHLKMMKKKEDHRKRRFD